MRGVELEHSLPHLDLAAVLAEHLGPDSDIYHVAHGHAEVPIVLGHVLAVPGEAVGLQGGQQQRQLDVVVTGVGELQVLLSITHGDRPRNDRDAVRVGAFLADLVVFGGEVVSVQHVGIAWDVVGLQLDPDPREPPLGVLGGGAVLFAFNGGLSDDLLFLVVPAAIEAGLGQLGKHGNMISDELGSSMRLTPILTDMPLIADAPRDICVDDFCATCQLCARDCPTDAITHEKQWVRGDFKWYVDFDKCVPAFNELYACGICLAVCPWSRPGVAPKLVQKMLRRREKQAGKAAETV